jgi:hypothetical protein
VVRIGWKPIVSAAVLIAAFVAVRCYGGSSYERGRRESEVAHTDSVRRAVTAKLDSANKVMVPVLEGLVRENDSLKAEARSARIAAAQASLAAKRLAGRLRDVSAALADSTPLSVRTLIDSLVIAEDSLGYRVEHLIAQSAADSIRMDGLVSEIRGWQQHYNDARAALDTANKEIAQLKSLKRPKRPKFGFRTGLLTGIIVTIGGILAAASLGH